jgi:hypothetical protein
MEHGGLDLNKQSKSSSGQHKSRRGRKRRPAPKSSTAVTQGMSCRYLKFTAPNRRTPPRARRAGGQHRLGVRNEHRFDHTTARIARVEPNQHGAGASETLVILRYKKKGKLTPSAWRRETRGRGGGEQTNPS